MGSTCAPGDNNDYEVEDDDDGDGDDCEVRLYLPSRDWGLAHRTCYLCLNKVVVVVV